MIDDRKSILDWAKFYRDLGFNIMPLKTFPEEVEQPEDRKRPLLKEWKHLQTRMATDEEIAEWFSKPRNIAVICGKISGNLVVVDFDREGVYEKFFPQHEELERETLVAKPSKGRHVYLRSSILVDSFKIVDLGIDVKAEGGYVVAPPSIHPSGHVYQFVNPEVKDILTVTDLEETIWKKAEALGVKRPESFLIEKDDPPCIKILLKGVEEGLRNEAAIRLAAYWLYFRNETLTIARELLTRWNYKNKPEPLPKSELDNILKSVTRGRYEYGCPSMRQIGVCTPEIAKECPIAQKLEVKWRKTIYTPTVALRDGRLVEQCWDPEKEQTYYVIFDPKTKKFEKADYIVDDAIDPPRRYVPINDEKNLERLEKGLVLLPSWPDESIILSDGIIDDKKLWKEAEAFKRKYHEELNDFETQTSINCSALSWIQDCVPKITFRKWTGEFGTGKSVGAKTCAAISYRPVFLAGADTQAAMRRLMDMWRGTYMIDEGDFTDSSLYAFVTKTMNIGNDRRLGWYQCCNDKDPSKIENFYVYGMRFVATRRKYKDPALESRFLTAPSGEATEDLPVYQTKPFWDQALKLRNMWLTWRFYNYHKIKEIGAMLEQEKIDLPIPGRVKEIMIPLMLIIKDESLKKEFRKVLLEKAYEVETEYKRALHREVVDALTRTYGLSGLNYLEPIEISYDDLLNEIGDKDLTSQKLRWPIKDLGFKTKKIGRSKETKIIIDPQLLKRHKKIYLDRFEKLQQALGFLEGGTNKTSPPSTQVRIDNVSLVFRPVPYNEVMPLCEFCPAIDMKQAAWYKVECDETGNEVLRPICHECKAKFVEI